MLFNLFATVHYELMLPIATRVPSFQSFSIQQAFYAQVVYIQNVMIQ
jgi:hypothetical protein